MLSVYYETDHAMTEKVLTRKIPMWRDRSLIEVAGDFKAKFFIEQPATQIVVKKAWTGEVNLTVIIQIKPLYLGL